LSIGHKKRQAAFIKTQSLKIATCLKTVVLSNHEEVNYTSFTFLSK